MPADSMSNILMLTGSIFMLTELMMRRASAWRSGGARPISNM
jgi:hypothetical protein